MADRQRQITETRNEVLRQVREEITQLVNEEIERQGGGDQQNGQNGGRRNDLAAILQADIQAMTQSLERRSDDSYSDGGYGGRVQFPFQGTWRVDDRGVFTGQSRTRNW